MHALGEREPHRLTAVAPERAADSCRVCGAVAVASTLSRAGDTYTSTWVRCADCGVERITPYPTQDELEAYYNDAYVTKQCTGSVSHAVRYSDEYRARVHEEYALGLRDLGIEPGTLATLNVLDYGCAQGDFLDFLRAAGSPPERVTGADIATEMVEVAVERGHRAMSIAELRTLPDGSFDLITLWDVVEHLVEPAGTIRDLRRLVAPGGRIIVQTPRMGLLSEALGSAFEHYLPLEHVHLFRRETLVRLFSEAGFDLVAAASFGANAPAEAVPLPYKGAFDRLAKATDNGATQLAAFAIAPGRDA
jgi:2-polyprenyl-3-methyl-5-hydroxy-6-metoxy-1,4-benzoquinol methylase